MRRKSRGHIGNNIRNGVVGYCHHRDHNGYISKRTLKEHKCIEKNCRCFEKYDVQYWDTLIDKKVIKKLSKFYIKNIDCFYGLSKDSFISKAKLYYKQYKKVPFDNEDRLAIKDFLFQLNQDGYYREKETIEET